MKDNNLIIAGKDCEGCEHYTFGTDKRAHCELKGKSFFYGQYIVCENAKNKKKKGK